MMEPLADSAKVLTTATTKSQRSTSNNSSVLGSPGKARSVAKLSTTKPSVSFKKDRIATNSDEPMSLSSRPDSSSSTSSAAGAFADASDESEAPWDISRINKSWEIDRELRRSLPFLARAKRSDHESAADKFLRLSKLPLPAVPNVESMFVDIPHERKGSQKSLALTPKAKAKYFGAGAKTECHAIFRKLAAQKYLTNQPLNEFLSEQQARDERETALLGTPSMTPLRIRRTGATMQDADYNRNAYDNNDDSTKTLLPYISRQDSAAVNLFENHFHQVDRRGLFSRQFTARHKFSALCLEKDLPPCIRLIVRNYFSPEINVSHMSIGDELASVFAECLHDLPMVTGLNMRNNRLGDKGLRAIIDVVITKRDLYHIDLSENKVDGAAAGALALYLGSATCALQSMKLSRADVDDSELAPFAKALHTNKSLETLDLSRNLVGSTENLNVVRPSIVTGGEALATMLSINYTLTFLDLSWNYLRLGGAVELGKALAFNSGLRELNLSYNAFGNAGAQAIGESLLSNICLEKLNLSNNNIPAHGAQAIASAMKLNNKIVYVNFDGNPLGQTGGRALLHAVAACTERQMSVSMEGCNFDLTDADAFDPSESTGTYELNMEVPYERAIALELLRVANTKQGCKFLSIVHTSSASKVKRTIKVELREAAGSDAHRRLLKTAGILTDSAADEQEMKQFKLDRPSLVALFYELDQDESGFVDDTELKQGMRKLGLAFRDEDILRYIAQYDLDGTGTIELDEFVELMGSFNLEEGHFARQCVDLETSQPFEIPTEGKLQIDFVDFHVSVDHDNAHSHAGVERLIENISVSKNKSQMLAMAKSGLFFKADEAQLLLESVADVYEITQAVTILLPNMVDPKNAYALIDHNLNASQRVRLQHLIGQALQPMIGLSTGHYKLDLGNDLDRLTLKKIIENSNRTAFLRKKAGLKDTSQHGNYHGFRNETMNGKPLVLEPQFLDKLPRFGMVEFDYVQIGRTPSHPVSLKRFEQILSICQLGLMGPTLGVRTTPASGSTATTNGRGGQKRSMSTTPATPGGRSTTSTKNKSGGRATPADKAKLSPFPPLRQYTRALYSELENMKTLKNYLKFGDGLNRVVELREDPQAQVVAISPVSEPFPAAKAMTEDDSVDAAAGPDDQENPQTSSSEDPSDPNVTANTVKKDTSDSDNCAAMVIKKDGKATCTARRLLFNLQWLLSMRWVTAQQAVCLLSVWPTAFESSRIDLVCVLFDRLTDLHNFNGILSALSDAEAAQCFYRFGWLNLWTPLLPDNYYELNLSTYEEREVAKALVRLAIDEPGENWQRETFGWSREELIPGWELNMSWLKDGGFPEKGYLCLEYYSGADKGCGPVWPTRRELASGTLCGLPENEVDEIINYVDSLSMVPAGHRRSVMG